MSPDATPPHPPFNDNADPEPWQFCNELHALTLEEFRFILCDLRATNRDAYTALVLQTRNRRR